MARFLFTTLPTNDLGLVTRGLPIAEGLAERGHEVVFSAPGTAPAAQVAAAGFRNVLPAHPIFDLFHRGAGARGVLRLLASRPRRPGHPGRVATIRQLIAAAPRAAAPADEQPWDSDHAAAQMGLSSVGFVRAGATATVELLERLDPDVVVDLWNPFAAIAARASGRRRVSVIQGDAHPASAGFIWWRPRPPETPTSTAAINVVLAELGAEPVGRFAELAVGDRTVVVGTPRTDPLPPGTDVTYVGPCLPRDRGEPLPSSIDEIAHGRPLLWVYAGTPRYRRTRFGSNMDGEVLLRAAIDAFSDTETAVALTTGHHRPPRSAARLPDNFLAFDHLPGAAIAARCDALVHHGGYGSCQLGLVAGVPAVIAPTYSERESNARRIEALGAGIMVPVERTGRHTTISPSQLRDAAMTAIASEAMRGAATELGSHLAGFGGPGTAADVIESAVGRESGPTGG